MTIFGLRPRHTSIVITTLTGSVIACTTLALSMMFSQDVSDIVRGTSERIDRLKDREGQLLTRVDQLAEEVRRGTIIWNYDEKITLTTIRANSSEQAVRDSISEMIVQANYLSIIRNNRVARYQNAEQFEPNSLLVQYSAEDFEAWVRTYTLQPQPMGLWLEVTENCMFKDPVPVKVSSFPVRALFSEGETVFSMDVRPDAFLNDWYDFLDKLKATALRRGMIEMNGSLGGGLTGDPLMEISRKVVNAGGRVRLRAVANRELYQSSNLDVSIKVESQ